MRKIAARFIVAGIALGAAIAVPRGADALTHYTSLDEALAAAAKAQKPVLADFGTSW